MASLRNCTFILGYVRILNAKFVDFASSNSSQFATDDDEPLFPNITEITDYLLVFQAHHITHLGQLLPRLSIIHGTRLFRSAFSLVLFLSPSLTHINLGRLVSIRRGTVLLSRLYHVCYVNTIDWSRIVVSHARTDASFDDEINNNIHNTDSVIKTNLINRNCVGQICLGGGGFKHCWTDRVAQIECSRECSTNGCNLDVPSQCCGAHSECLYCVNSTK